MRGLPCLPALLPPACSAASLFSAALQPCPASVQLWEPSTSLPGPQQGAWGVISVSWHSFALGHCSFLVQAGGPAQAGTTGSQMTAGLQLIHRSTIRVFFWCSMGTPYKAPNIFPFGNLREQVSCTGLSLGPSGVEWGDTCFLTSQNEPLNTSQLLVSFCEVLIHCFPISPFSPPLLGLFSPLCFLHKNRLGWFPDSHLPKLSLWPEESDRPH